jgi:secreted trypsin-like serine protease
MKAISLSKSLQVKSGRFSPIKAAGFLEKGYRVMNKFVFLFCSLLLSPAFAITGGEPLSAEFAPYVVNIKVKWGVCSGTVVGPRTVLTAAHCVDRFGAPEVVAFITAGATRPCDIRNVVDKAYVPGSEAILPFNVHAPDIMLLKLNEPLCSTKEASLAKTSPQTDDVLWAAGQGMGNKVYGQAEKTSIRLIQTDTAPGFARPIDSITQEFLDVGSAFYLFGLPVAANSSICPGDSGGPVFLEDDGKMTVYGVNGAVITNDILGAPRCDYAYLQVLTPVAPYVDWIQSKIEEWK